MATKVICDKCGRTLDRSAAAVKLSDPGPFNGDPGVGRGGWNYSYDLCKQCYNDLRSWIVTSAETAAVASGS